MKFKSTYYTSLKGKVIIVEPESKTSTQAVVYQDDKPAYFVDCFDMDEDSNVEMNLLVLCQQRSMKAVINEIAERNSVNLHLKEAPIFAVKRNTRKVELELPPLPLDWVV